MYLSHQAIPNILEKDQVWLIKILRGIKWVPPTFSIFAFFSHFFMKWECWSKVLCLINCNHKKHFFGDFSQNYFFDGKTLIYPSDFLTFNVNFPDHFKVSLIRSSCNTFFMLDGRSAPTPYPREFFGWRLLLYPFLLSSLNVKSRYDA